MANINLLPWREAARARRQKEFFIGLTGACLSAVFLLIPIFFIINIFINEQLSRNETLQEEITKLDKEIAQVKDLKTRKQQLLDRTNVIELLQAQRTNIVKIFDEFINILPNGVYLTEFSKNGDKFKIKGFAETNDDISMLMRKIEQSNLLTAPVLLHIATEDKDNLNTNSFDMEMYQVNKQIHAIVTPVKDDQ